MTRLLCLALAGLPVVLGGCMSPRYYPSADPHRQLVPYMGRLSDAELEKMLATRTAVREPIAAGIAWILDDAGDSEADLPESERLALVRRLAGALERAPFSTVTVIPSARTRAREGVHVDDADIPALRSAAARFGHDVLVVVITHRSQYVDWNPLAVTYLALVPRYFVPGDSLAVYASVEVCALDVRTGLFLACAQGDGKAERMLATPIGRERRLRELSGTALGDAFESIPEALQQGVRTRLAAEVG